MEDTCTQESTSEYSSNETWTASSPEVDPLGESSSFTTRVCTDQRTVGNSDNKESDSLSVSYSKSKHDSFKIEMDNGESDFDSNPVKDEIKEEIEVEDFSYNASENDRYSNEGSPNVIFIKEEEEEEEKKEETVGEASTQLNESIDAGKTHKKKVKNFRLTRHQEELLCKFYRSNPCLYDKTRKDYQEYGWRFYQNIRRKVNLRSIEIKNWFNAMRSQYALLSNANYRKQTVLTERAKWILNNFYFLHNHIKHVHQDLLPPAELQTFIPQHLAHDIHETIQSISVVENLLKTNIGPRTHVEGQVRSLFSSYVHQLKHISQKDWDELALKLHTAVTESLLTIQCGTHVKQRVQPKQPLQPVRPAQSFMLPVQPPKSLVQPIHPPQSSFVQPVQSSQSSFVQPVQSPQSSFVQPVQSSQSSLVQPVQSSQSSFVQPAQPPQSSSVQPIQPPQSSFVQPVQLPQSSVQLVQTPQSSFVQLVQLPQSSFLQPAQQNSGNQQQQSYQEGPLQPSSSTQQSNPSQIMTGTPYIFVIAPNTCTASSLADSYHNGLATPQGPPVPHQEMPSGS